jgi:hypothetical protein
VFLLTGPVFLCDGDQHDVSHPPRSPGENFTDPGLMSV